MHYISLNDAVASLLRTKFAKHHFVEVLPLQTPDGLPLEQDVRSELWTGMAWHILRKSAPEGSIIVYVRIWTDGWSLDRHKTEMNAPWSIYLILSNLPTELLSHELARELLCVCPESEVNQRMDKLVEELMELENRPLRAYSSFHGSQVDVVVRLLAIDGDYQSQVHKHASLNGARSKKSGLHSRRTSGTFINIKDVSTIKFRDGAQVYKWYLEKNFEKLQKEGHKAEMPRLFQLGYLIEFFYRYLSLDRLHFWDLGLIALLFDWITLLPDGDELAKLLDSLLKKAQDLQAEMKCPLELREVKGIYYRSKKSSRSRERTFPKLARRPLEGKEYHSIIKFSPAIFYELHEIHPSLYMLFCAAAAAQRSIYLDSLTLEQRQQLQNEIHAFKFRLRSTFSDPQCFNYERPNIDARTFYI